MKWVANILILAGLVLLIVIFVPIIKEETRYNLDQMMHVKYVIGSEQLSTFEKPLIPPNTDYSIIIPKIGAVAPIIDNVDPTNPENYLPALKKGVAHAIGTANPVDTEGNVYLFAHSTDAFWDVTAYNAVFYLIGKLSTGDEVDIFYRGKMYKYQIYAKNVVSPNSVQYLGTLLPGTNTLTLQTCYPPGTTLQRLIVLGKLVKN